jgi:ABC-2 type transport system permease protein
MIRSTPTAVPKRRPALWAKAIVLTVVTAATAAVAIALSVAVALPTLHAHDVVINLGDSETQRILLGGALYLVAIVPSCAFVRLSAGALATVLGLILLSRTCPGDPRVVLRNLSSFLPSTAGHQITTTQPTIDQLRATSTVTRPRPWQGYGVMILWVVIRLAAAAVLLRRRDA